MSQSKPSYGANSRKGTARAHRHRPNTSDETTDSESDPEPACRSGSTGASVDGREWREVPYSPRLLASYSPCAWSECYPNGPPDVDDTETVVRSCSHPTTYHRPSAEHDPCDSEHNSTGADETATATPQFVAAADSGEYLSSITEVQEGNGVIWSGQSTPLLVIEAAAEPGGTLHLRGPDGGEYTVEARPDSARSYAVYPGVGVVTEMRRVMPADDQPRSGAV
jgi:hypothetical protein